MKSPIRCRFIEYSLACFALMVKPSLNAEAQWVQTNGPYDTFVSCLTVVDSSILVGIDVCRVLSIG